MKKLILSAVFALACFTAQAQTKEVINNDDKNPKNNAKKTTNTSQVSGSEIKSPGYVCSGGVKCPDGSVVEVYGTGASMQTACNNMLQSIDGSQCN